jgi:hypothetical protein
MCENSYRIVCVLQKKPEFEGRVDSDQENHEEADELDADGASQHNPSPYQPHPPHGTKFSKKSAN